MLLASTEIISKSLDDYLKNWHNWMIFSLMIFLPSFVLMLSGSFGGFLNTYLPSTTLPTDILILLLALASVLFGFWTSIALIHAVIKSLHGGKVSPWNEHYAATYSSIWPALFTSFIVVIFVFLGVIFFLIPGIILAVWYFFAVYSIIADDERSFKALAASKKLVRGRWWSVSWRIVVPWLFFGTAALIAQNMLLVVSSYLPLNIITSSLIDNIIIGAVNALIAPLTVLSGVNLFNSLKSNPFREKPAIFSNESPTE
jgi:hypothetical protein